MKPTVALTFLTAATIFLAGAPVAHAQNTNSKDPSVQTQDQVVPPHDPTAPIQVAPTSRSDEQSGQSAQAMQSAPSGQDNAAQMVPAQAALKTTLDVRKMQPGMQFQAVLDQTIHLNNGTELPHGTRLIGEVTTQNDTSFKGAASLALRFTQADLKDGKVVPIKATIMEVQPDLSTPADPNSQVLGSWDGKTVAVDQAGALPGVELHSRIDGNNSGVFVAAKKDDVKIDAGSQMELAIAVRG